MRIPWWVFVLGTVWFLAACSDTAGEAASYPKYSGESEPYILKEGCTFTIVLAEGTASVKSEVTGGAGLVSASGSVTMGTYSIEVSECDVIGNPSLLPVYEK